MSSRPKSTIWEAEPHTIAKIEIVKRYAHRWAAILGAKFRNQPLTYIDGFAGPGEYINHAEGSPTAVVKALADARLNSKGWLAGDIRCVFIENDKGRADYLVQKCAELEPTEGIDLTYKCCSFIEGIQQAQQEFGRAFLTNAPLLVFVDPFGATGAPFNLIKEVLKSGTSEVILNFDADGVARIWRAGQRADANRLLRDIFGDDSWKTIDASSLTHRELCFACAKLYKEKLLSLPKVDYAFSFEMGQAANRLDYFLIFASQNERGLEKMKEVMRSIDQTGDFRFYDTQVGQEQLIKFDSPELWIDLMAKRFAGEFVSFAEVKRWVLNETPFFTFSSTMLKPAAERGLLEAIPKDGETVRKGSFPPEKLKGIQFQ